MQAQRLDGILVEFTLSEPQENKKVGKSTFTKGKCNVCNQCWLTQTKEGRVFCEHGGPYIGYVKVD